MALEPITRQEQIIAGKDLEPITRMEKFLKKYGGSGGSGGVSPEEVTTIVKEQFPGGVGYEEVQTVNEPLNITWDGNTDRFNLVDYSDGMYFKVSDAVMTDEQIKKTTFAAGEMSVLIGDAWGMDGAVYATEDVVLFADVVIFCRTAGVASPSYGHSSIILPEPGVYVIAPNAANGLGGNFTLTTTEPVEHRTIVTTPISSKYLPGVFRVNLTSEDGETFVADKTFSEIVTAYREGMSIDASIVNLAFSDRHIYVGQLSYISLSLKEVGFLWTNGEIVVSQPNNP